MKKSSHDTDDRLIETYAKIKGIDEGCAEAIAQEFGMDVLEEAVQEYQEDQQGGKYEI